MIRVLLMFVAALCFSHLTIAEEASVSKAETTTTQVIDVTAPDASKGKMIFDTICTHCHHTDHETSSVGAPGLQDVLDRHDVAWINEWLQGPEDFAQKDETAKALTEANPYGLIMPTFPEMQDATNRANIIEFLKTLK